MIKYLTRRDIIIGTGSMAAALGAEQIYQTITDSKDYSQLNANDVAYGARFRPWPPVEGGLSNLFYSLQNPYDFSIEATVDASVTGPAFTQYTPPDRQRSYVLQPGDAMAAAFAVKYPDALPEGEYNGTITTTVRTVDSLSGDVERDAKKLDQTSTSKTGVVGIGTPLPPMLRPLANNLVDASKSVVKHVVDFAEKPFAGLLGGAYGMYNATLSILNEAKTLLTSFWEYLQDTIKSYIALLTHMPWEIIMRIYNKFKNKAKRHTPAIYGNEQGNAFIVGFVLGYAVFYMLKFYVSKRVRLGKFTDMKSGVKEVIGNRTAFSKFADKIPRGNSDIGDLPDSAHKNHLRLRTSGRFNWEKAEEIIRRTDKEIITPSQLENCLKDVRFLQRFSHDDSVVDPQKIDKGMLGEANLYRKLSMKEGAKFIEAPNDLPPNKKGRYLLHSVEVKGNRGEIDTLVLKVDSNKSWEVQKAYEVKTKPSGNVHNPTRQLESNLEDAHEYGVEDIDIPREKLDPNNIDQTVASPKQESYGTSVLDYTVKEFKELWRFQNYYGGGYKLFNPTETIRDVRRKTQNGEL